MRTAPLRRRPLFLLLSMSATFGVVGAAHAAQSQTLSPVVVARNTSVATPDPFERLNRKTFALNQVLDRVFIRPLAVFWHRAAPRPVRTAVNNVTSNLSEPLVLINDVLQGHPVTALRTAARFAGNTIVGLGGLIDVTGPSGIPHHDNGFGLTLGRWGVKTGPYLYLPVLGPTTLRDGTGSIVDIGLSPLTYASTFLDNGLGTGLGVASGLDTRANADSDLKALKALSTDEYAALRSFYLQNRQAQVSGGKIDLNALPDFDDPGAAAAAGPVTAPAAPGSIAPSATALTAPAAAVPGVPVGDAAALPSPATPAEPASTAPTPPADPKGV